MSAHEQNVTMFAEGFWNMRFNMFANSWKKLLAKTGKAYINFCASYKSSIKVANLAVQFQATLANWMTNLC